MSKVYIACGPWMETSGKDGYRRVVLVPWLVGKLAVLDELYSPASGPGDKERIDVGNGDYFRTEQLRAAYERWERRMRECVFINGLYVNHEFATPDVVTRANAAAVA